MVIVSAGLLLCGTRTGFEPRSHAAQGHPVPLTWPEEVWSRWLYRSIRSYTLRLVVVVKQKDSETKGLPPKGLRLNKRTPIALRRHSTDNKQAQECAACACMLLHCCAALMHRADACAALQLLLLPVCCGACSRRPPCIIRVARRRLATQMCLCRGCCQTWRWHLRPCAHRHTADTRPRTRDTRA